MISNDYNNLVAYQYTEADNYVNAVKEYRKLIRHWTDTGYTLIKPALGSFHDYPSRMTLCLSSHVYDDDTLINVDPYHAPDVGTCYPSVYIGAGIAIEFKANACFLNDLIIDSGGKLIIRGTAFFHQHVYQHDNSIVTLCGSSIYHKSK